jgi:Flp pilus assembly protein TadG
MSNGMALTSRRDARNHNRRGTILILFAFVMIVIMGLLAFTIDLGHIVVTESELQNAADAAAMSGARGLKDGSTAACAAAKSWAAMNIVAGQPIELDDADIEIGIWDTTNATFTPWSSSSSQQPNAVRVTCSRTTAKGNPLPLFFAPILGTSHADVKASATAKVNLTICGQFIGIDKVVLSGGSYTDSYNSSTGSYSGSSAGNQGHVCSDGPITLSSSSFVNGNALPGSGSSVSMSGGSFVTGSTQPRTAPLNLPPVDFGDSASNNLNTQIPTSDAGAIPYNTSTKEFKLSGGDHVTLAAGTYYFSKFTLSGGSSITVTGPTKIYCVGDFTASGSSIANTTFKPANLQVFCTGSKVDISGGSNFYGTVYAPTSKVVRSSGSNHVFGSLIGKELTLSGGGGAHADLSLGLMNGGADGLVELTQ